MDFLPWFQNNNGYVNPSAELVSGEGQFSICVRQGHSIEKNEIVVSCPHALTFSLSNAQERSGVNKGSRAEISHLPRIVAFRLLLMEHYLAGELSFWWPYLKSLPQPNTKNTFHTPTYFDALDDIWLEGTNAGVAAKARVEAWRIEFEHANTALGMLEEDERAAWTFDLYQWAATIITSRSFPAAPSCRDAVGLPVLIPGLDLLNHSPTSRVSWDWSSSKCTIRTDEDILEACQIYNNYGPKSNEELLLGYGFCLQPNPADTFNVSYSPAMAKELQALKGTVEPFEGQNTVQKATVLQDNDQDIKTHASALETNTTKEVHSIRLNRSVEGDAADSDVPPTQAYAFSSSFISDFSLVLANRRERAQTKPCCEPSVTSFTRDTISRNKVHVIASIIMILQHKRAAIRQHDSNLPKHPQNQNQEYASIYRSIKLEILEGVLVHLSDDLTAMKRLEIGNIPRMISLQWVMTKPEKQIKVPLRKVVKAGLGTRDVAKIEERGGTEFAFTMWLCALWLLYQKEELTGSLQLWMAFLCRTYDVNCQSEDDADIVSSYLEAIEALIAVHPESIYNDSDLVTVARLHWCLDIVREEGVRCPSEEGQTAALEGEEDEFIIIIDGFQDNDSADVMS